MSNQPVSYVKGENLFNDYEYHRAIGAFTEFLEKEDHPHNNDRIEALNYIAKSYFFLGLYSDCDSYFKKSLSIQQLQQEPYLYFGWIALNQNDLVQAIKIFNQIIERDPENSEVTIKLSEAYHKNNQINESIKLLEQSTNKNTKILLKLANFCFLDARYETAKEVSLQLTDSTEKYLMLAKIHKAIGDKSGAINSYDHLINIDPEDDEALYSKASLIFDDDLDCALDLVDKVLKINPYMREAIILKSQILIKQGKLKESNQCLEAANNYFGYN